MIAGILLDVVSDFVRESYSAEMLQRRLGDKFGADVLDCAVAACERHLDAAGVEMTPAERRDERLQRLGEISDAARWVFAAEALHTAGSLLADLRRTFEPSTVWRRYAAGRRGIVDWYRAATARLDGVGFQTAITEELRVVVSAFGTVAD